MHFLGKRGSFFLPFEVGGLEFLFTAPRGATASSAALAAVNADEDEEQECQNGAHNHGNQ